MTLLSRLPTRRSGSPFSSLGISTILAGLLAVVAAAAAGHRHAGGHAGRPSRAFFDYLFSAGFVFMTVGAVAITYLLWRDREDMLTERKRGGRQTTRALVLLLVLALLLVGAHRAGIRPSAIFHKSPKVSQVVPAKQHTGSPAAAPASRSHFRWLPALAAGGFFLAVVVLAAFNSARRRVAMRDSLDAAAEVAAALDESVDDLRAEPDPRRAIIAAYARMERALAVAGVARRPAEAPLEYMARALEGLNASTVSVRRLTELFRVAKFSAHRLGPDDKESAIAALIAVRDELRAERRA